MWVVSGADGLAIREGGSEQARAEGGEAPKSLAHLRGIIQVVCLQVIL